MTPWLLRRPFGSIWKAAYIICVTIYMNTYKLKNVMIYIYISIYIIYETVRKDLYSYPEIQSTTSFNRYSKEGIIQKKKHHFLKNGA